VQIEKKPKSTVLELSKKSTEEQEWRVDSNFIKEISVLKSVKTREVNVKEFKE
jgi:hypothetical protein